MRKTEWIEDLRSTEDGRRLLERERVWLEATETLCKLMESRGVSSAELARKLGISPARVSQLLSGTRNLTLATLADAFHALGRSMLVAHGPPVEKVKVGGPKGRSNGAGKEVRRRVPRPASPAQNRRPPKRKSTGNPDRRA
jgi:transcriptional regulator with XRE-family HTH domain